MIIDHQPNPRLTWPARLCLLALAGVVLPASIVAVAEDEPTKEPQSTATSGNTPPDSVTATEILDDESARQEENIKTKTFTVPNNINFDAINQFLHSFYILRPKPAVTIRARDGNFEIVVRSTEEQLKAVERVIAAMTGASDSATSKVSASGETITVVRAQYVLPHNVAEAFDKFIQQHGEHFEFLVSKVSGAPRNSFGDPMMGMDMGVDMGMGAGMGMGLDPSMLEMGDEYGIGAGMMRGGFARRGLSRGARRGDTQSQLTIIATPEVQQQFGDFIKALSAVQQPKARAADEDATETLTLTRAHYDLPVVSTSALLEVSRPYGFGPSILNDPRGRRAFINDLLTGDTLPPSLGIGVWDILTAVKQSNLVPLLLISADDDRLTVTTTEDFQQQLGKFIRFLQEHEPQTDDEQTKRRPESDSADISRIADQHQREQKAAALLKKAREFLSKGELGRARAMVMEASKLDVDYHLFDDRPEHVLADIERREGRARDEGKLTVLRADSGSIQSLAGEWPPQRKSSGSRLSELRDQERELSALLSVIDESLKEEANRMLLLLAINQFYGDNAASASLIEMFNKLVELETQKGELVQSHGLRHPSLMFVQQRIDTYRRSFGLPTGDDAQPLDLLDIYVQALKRQLDVTRKVIDALEKSK